MASIQKRTTKNGKTRYRARITLAGYPRLSETFSSRRAADRWARRTEEELLAGSYSPQSRSGRHTVGDMLDRYYREKLPSLSDQHTGVRLRWWGEQLGRSTLLSEVTPAVITTVRDRLAAGDSISGKTPSPSTVRKYLTGLSSAFSLAHQDWLWIDNNPVHSIRKPLEPRGRVRFLDDDERTRLLASCKESSEPRLYPLVVMGLFTGARKTELMTLQWQDIDLERGVATLHHTKNGERRALAITGMAAEALQEWSKVRRIDTDLVFPSRHGKPVFPNPAWIKARKDASITAFRFHDLRHTFASYLAMSGATLAELAEAMGHKTLSMVKRYAHMTEGHTVSVVARMTGRFQDGQSPLSAVV